MHDPLAPFDLKDAPEAFFDKPDWQAFVAFHRDRDTALQRISVEEPGMIGFYRKMLAEGPTPEGLHAREEEKVVQVGRSMVTKFLLGLSEGRILASGFTSLQVARISIPTERWAGLRPNFVKGRAEAGEDGITFENVLVWTPAEASINSGGEEDALRNFLRKRQQDGVRLKKILQDEANIDFQGLTTRAFDAAYKDVFETGRGRPKTRR